MRKFLKDALDTVSLILWGIILATIIILSFILIIGGFASIPSFIILIILQICGVICLPLWVYIVLIIYGIIFSALMIQSYKEYEELNSYQDKDDDVLYFIEKD